MNEEESTSFSDLLIPDTTWEAYFPIKLEPVDEPPDLEVSTSKNNGVDCPVSTTSTGLLHQDHSISSCLTGSFDYKLNAPTSGCVRKGECSLTFLNKDQLYGFRIEHDPFGEKGHPSEFLFTTLISLQFPAGSNDLDPISMWRMWASKQPKLPSQALKVDVPSTTTEVIEVREVALNGVKITWSPQGKPVELFLSVSCLSTDFTNQKGVKGIPVMLQVDTKWSTLQTRAVAKIKTFCDKGADRKLRQEERRLSKFTPPYPCESSTPFTGFTRVFPPFEDPILFTPNDEDGNGNVPLKERTEAEEMRANNLVLDTDFAYRGTLGQFRPRKSMIFPEEPFLYVRQVNEKTYTELHLSRPTLDGLIASICSKYQIEAFEIRRVYLKTLKCLVVHVDQDYVRALAGSRYKMKILVIENSDKNASIDHARPKYDIILCETSDKS